MSERSEHDRLAATDAGRPAWLEVALAEYGFPCERVGPNVGELWEPGYYHTSGAYVETMRALEDADQLGTIAIVLSPTVRLSGGRD